MHPAPLVPPSHPLAELDGVVLPACLIHIHLSRSPHRLSLALVVVFFPPALVHLLGTVWWNSYVPSSGSL
ncbi:uncharacterized protein HD556DRAFT_1448724 [Suillus plorans]|uniref:Uncharacterized protein n=1 Tax=Suillus plorans TaxID=116603 RepID=A0A9P7DCR3_9AGAM|nr:uncharacterized protein HD556DRAFT_1448724 [Suillus plorans]KAG1787535.1 hypothetical protein HD556DRAFT_1448724 [Suillus plorans]